MSFPSHYTRAAFKEAGGKLVIEEVELTPPGPGEVLVKVEACGVCFSDTAAQTFAWVVNCVFLIVFIPQPRSLHEEAFPWRWLTC
jgi:D-arabinose 1-dehydrogenase-like Zn-dependent alcohol dehydrogenase